MKSGANVEKLDWYTVLNSVMEMEMSLSYFKIIKESEPSDDYRGNGGPLWPVFAHIYKIWPWAAVRQKLDAMKKFGWKSEFT